MGIIENEIDRMKAQKIAHEKAKEIMSSMDICDKEHINYPRYLLELEYRLYVAIKKALRL